jgi:hypothetical protein
MPEDTVCMQCKEKKGKKGKGKTPSLIPRYFKQRVEKGERERERKEGTRIEYLSTSTSVVPDAF